MDRTNKPKPSADDLSRDQLEDLMARALEGSSPRGIGKKLTEGMSPEHPYDITPAPEECDRLLTLEGINVGDKQDIDYVSDHTLFVLKPRHETKSFVLQNIGISKLVDDKGNIIGGSISVHPGDVVRFLEPLFPGEEPVSAYIRIPDLFRSERSDSASPSDVLNTPSNMTTEDPTHVELHQQELLDTFLASTDSMLTGLLSFSVRYPSTVGKHQTNLHFYGATEGQRDLLLGAFERFCKSELPNPVMRIAVPDVLRKIHTICVIPADSMIDENGEHVSGFWNRKKGFLALSPEVLEHLSQRQPRKGLRALIPGRSRGAEVLISFLSTLPEEQSFFSFSE